MSRWSLILVLTSTLLLVECGEKQTPCVPTNQNPGQSSAGQPEVWPQVRPVPPPVDQSNADRNSYKPKDGYVPDEQTAIAIAVAVWIPIYGKEQIESEKPFKATLKDGVWFVTGSLRENMVGGTAIAEISQDSGGILRVIHYK
jgi:hypothetical protein